ncbi:DUF5696 domain-containing protein [Paenibacillus thermotolerans]|uniref:DUF5696 domain-containing protein n=1 Tax=Paenibacillus thermotolerans TaxID=3027807 RepID=UPI0023678F33|nr:MULTISPECIES: DUF5696 domain-containing protein [unclassified Paenibacillus]
MLKRIWPESGSLRLLYLLAVGVLLMSATVTIVRWERLPSLKEMNIGEPPDPSFNVAQGQPWKPATVRSDGFAEISQNDRFVLYVEPETSQVAVLNKQSGFLWRSNPSKEHIERETVSGTQLQNLESPFILEYVSGKNTRRIQSNSLDPKLSFGYIAIDGGIQVTYTYQNPALSFVLQYKLTDYGLELLIPDQGIQESEQAKVFAINPLPFFGAVSGTEEQGYMFVPDGPGGLIRYDRHRPANVRGYEFPIYGDDPAHLKEGFRKPKREQISFPVFGLTRGDQAFVSIVKEGKGNASVKALPSGIVSTYHSLSANFTYREEYGRKVSELSGETVKAVEDGRVRVDRRIEYRLLSGADADYAGMARSYGQYLEESGGLPKRLQPTDHIPLQLSVIGGGTKRKFGGYRYEPATTFAQAEEIVDRLMERGVAKLQVVYQGWQSSGREFTDQRFPIVKELGGADGAKRFVQRMNERGVQVMFEDFIGWKKPEYSDFTMKSDGIRSIDSTVLQGRFRFNDNFTIIPGLLGDFIVSPKTAIRKQKEVIDALEYIGVNGIHYADGPGNLLFSDYNPAARLSREDTAFYYNALLDYTKSRLGTVGVTRGNDYALSHSNLIEAFPFESSYDLVVDETVPFYPIAVHGFVEYTTRPGNLRNDPAVDFLKSIEYGALPSFKVTYRPSRVLMNTDYEYVYSGEFAVWKDRIAEEYKQFDKLARVVHQRITDHEQSEDGVFVTTYEDGTKVTVNYNTKQFDVTGGKAE